MQTAKQHDQHAATMKGLNAAPTAEPAGPHHLSPPKEPSAHHRMRDTKPFHYRGVHATKSQSYSPVYSTPSADSRVDSFADGIFQSPQAQQAYLEHQICYKQYVSSLRYRLSFLKAQASSIAVTYRNFGLLYHCFPKHIIWHRAIDPEIRGFARANFLAGEGYPLPDIVHVIGTMESVLHATGERMQEMWPKEAETTRVGAELGLADRMVIEAMPQLELSRQAIEVFCRMRAISRMEGRTKDESPKKSRQRANVYEAWAHAVPSVCWEGIQDGEIDELTAAQNVVLST